jgi:hypothetical protein
MLDKLKEKGILRGIGILLVGGLVLFSWWTGLFYIVFYVLGLYGVIYIVSYIFRTTAIISLLITLGGLFLYAISAVTALYLLYFILQIMFTGSFLLGLLLLFLFGVLGAVLYFIPMAIGLVLGYPLLFMHEDIEKRFNTEHKKIEEYEYTSDDKGIDNTSNILLEDKETVSTTQVHINISKHKIGKNITRKVDWKKVAEVAKITGNTGEAYVLEVERENLKSNGRTDLAEKIKHVAQFSGYVGYDVLSYATDGKEKHIEVKSTSRSIMKSVIITFNELDFLKNNIDSSYVYIVTDTETQHISVKEFTGYEFLKIAEFEPIEYKIHL